MIDLAYAEELRKQLAVKGTGAHAHAAGKASFYLGRIAGKAKARFSNCSVDEFVHEVEMALARDEWEPLSTLMGRWW